MRSNPFVTVVVLFSLALAIGASTAIFSVVDAVLLRALPYQEPDRIALLWMTNTLRGDRVNVAYRTSTIGKHGIESSSVWRSTGKSKAPY
jgi:hypothetical protein